MELIRLSIKQVKELYKEKMVNDFPPMELRPLKMIIEPMKNKIYECYGLTDGDVILAYAFFVKMGENYLFDYLAVTQEKRNGGIGTQMVTMLREHFANAQSVIGEVEDPDCAENEDDRALQERRLNFYLRNGFVYTGLKVMLFGVNYKVLEIDFGKQHSKEEIELLYKAHYKTMLPEKLYKTQVIIKN